MQLRKDIVPLGSGLWNRIGTIGAFLVFMNVKKVNVKNRTCTYLSHNFIMLINMPYHISDSVFILCTAHDTMISV